MERGYEDIYTIAEEKHPWFVARRELFSSLIEGKRDRRILDVGCGTGMFLVHLKDLGFENLAGVETSRNLRERFRDRTVNLHEELPDETFDIIFMLDVLEHIEDDRGTLAKIYRILKPRGSYYLSVPAYQFLWSHHDELNQHKRRYHKPDLEEKLVTAGFRIRKLSYWNMFGFPPICLASWLGLRKSSGLELGHPLGLKLYLALLRFENRILKRFDLPVGVSLIAVAEKPGI